MKRGLLFIGLLLVATLCSVGSASAIDIDPQACSNAAGSVLCAGKDENVAVASNGQKSFVQQLTEIILFLVGTAAVIAIVIGGIRYTTSNGDASKVKSAKDTVMYAVVGLIVALMAWAIVSFVVNRVAA